MTAFTAARDPRWEDAERTRLDIEVDYPEAGTRRVTVAADADYVEGGIELWERALAGDFGEIAEPAAPGLTRAALIARAKAAVGKTTGANKSAMLAIIDAIEAG